MRRYIRFAVLFAMFASSPAFCQLDSYVGKTHRQLLGSPVASTRLDTLIFRLAIIADSTIRQLQQAGLVPTDSIFIVGDANSYNPAGVTNVSIQVHNDTTATLLAARIYGGGTGARYGILEVNDTSNLVSLASSKTGTVPSGNAAWPIAIYVGSRQATINSDGFSIGTAEPLSGVDLEVYKANPSFYFIDSDYEKTHTLATADTSLIQMAFTTGTPLIAMRNETGSAIVIDIPATSFTLWSLTLPADDGTSGQVLQTDGSGNTSWTAVAGLTGDSTYVRVMADTLRGGLSGQKVVIDDEVYIHDALGVGAMPNVALDIYKSAASLWLVNSTYEKTHTIANTDTSYVMLNFNSGGQPGITFGNVNGQSVKIWPLNSGVTTWTMTLPPNDGTAGQVLRTDGSGVTTWVTHADSTYEIVTLDTLKVKADDRISVMDALVVNVTTNNKSVSNQTSGDIVFGGVGANPHLSLINSTFEKSFTSGIADTSVATLIVNSAGTPQILMREADGKLLTLSQSASQSVDWTFTLPTTAGTSGQVLTTNGSGVSSWSAPAGGWQDTGTEVILSSVSDSVAIGTTSATQKLTVVGNIIAERLLALSGGSMSVNNAGTAVADIEVFTGSARILLVDTDIDKVHAALGTADSSSLHMYPMEIDMFNATGSQLQIKMSSTATGVNQFVFPVNQGSANQVLTSNGAGVTSWGDPSSGGWSDGGKTIDLATTGDRVRMKLAAGDSVVHKMYTTYPATYYYDGANAGLQLYASGNDGYVGSVAGNLVLFSGDVISWVVDANHDLRPNTTYDLGTASFPVDTIRANTVLVNTDFKVPNGAAPTTNAFGEIAADNNAWAANRGALQVYDGTANTYAVASLASDVPTNGQVPQWNTGGTVTWENISAVGSTNTTTTLLSGTYTGATTDSSAAFVCTNYDRVRFHLKITAQSGTNASIRYFYYAEGATVGNFNLEYGRSHEALNTGNSYETTWEMSTAALDSFKVRQEKRGTSPSFTLTLKATGIPRAYSHVYTFTPPTFTVVLTAGNTFNDTVNLPYNCTGVSIFSSASNAPQLNEAYLRIGSIASTARVGTLFTGTTQNQGTQSDTNGASRIELNLQANASSTTTFTIQLSYRTEL